MPSTPAADLARTRNVLILEPVAEGHPAEWMQHLMRGAMAQTGVIVWFVIARELHEALSRACPPAFRDRIRILALHPREQRLCRHASLTVRAFAYWWVMRRYVRLTGASAAHFLSLDLLSLPLALGFGVRGSALSGILFRPSVHYGAIGPYRPSLAERIRDLRKSVLYRLMLRNRALRAVLSLDPYFPAYAARHYRHGGKVQPIPDPLCPTDAADAHDGGTVDVPPGRTSFVLFGYLAERKGVLKLLDALRLLSGPVAAQVAVVFAGRVEPKIREDVAARVRTLANTQPGLWLRIEDRWIATGELSRLVERCDVVAAPYQRFVGSSGVLMWAARAGKPVLTQDYGLIGRLVQDFSLGLAVETCDARSLALAISRMVERGPHTFFDWRAAADFIAERSPDRFAADVFAALDSRRVTYVATDWSHGEQRTQTGHKTHVSSYGE